MNRAIHSAFALLVLVGACTNTEPAPASDPAGGSWGCVDATANGVCYCTRPFAAGSSLSANATCQETACCFTYQTASVTSCDCVGDGYLKGLHQTCEDTMAAYPPAGSTKAQRVATCPGAAGPSPGPASDGGGVATDGGAGACGAATGGSLTATLSDGANTNVQLGSYVADAVGGGLSTFSGGKKSLIVNGVGDINGVQGSLLVDIYESPTVGKTYTLTSSASILEPGSVAVVYEQLDAAKGDSCWIAGAGTVTVTAFDGCRASLVVSRAAMQPDPSKYSLCGTTNHAAGTFRMEAKATDAPMKND